MGTAVALVAGLVALYLLREPLLARPLGRLVAAQLDQALGGRHAVAAVTGTWFDELVVQDLRTLEEPQQGVLRRIEAERIVLRYGLWQLLTADPAAKLSAIEVAGLNVELGPGAPDGEAADGDPMARLARLLGTIDLAGLPELAVAGRVAVRDAAGLALAAGFELDGRAGRYRLRSPEPRLAGQVLPPLELELALTATTAGTRLRANALQDPLGLDLELLTADHGDWSLTAGLTGLEGTAQVAASSTEAWMLTLDDLQLATLPDWGWALARIPDQLRPERGVLDAQASGPWPPSTAELTAELHDLQLAGRELDRASLAASWDGSEFALSRLEATGLGSELTLSGLRLATAAPYLIELERLEASSADTALLARLLALAVPEEVLPRERVRAELSARAAADGGLEAELVFDSERLSAEGSGRVGPELFAGDWREAGLQAALTTRLAVPAGPSATATVELGGALGDPRGELRLEAKDLAWRELQLDHVELEAELVDGQLRLQQGLARGSDLRARIGGACDLATGRCDGFIVRLELDRLEAVNALLEAPLPVTGQAVVTLRFDGTPWPPERILETGSGSLRIAAANLGYAAHRLPALEFGLDFAPGRARVTQLGLELPERELALALVEPFELQIVAAGWSVDRLVLAGDEARISGQASGRGWQLETADLRLDDLPSTLLEALPLDLPTMTGSWDGGLELANASGVPSFQVQLRSRELTVDGVPGRVALRLAQDPERTRIEELELQAEGGLQLQLSGEIPWWTSLGAIHRREGHEPVLELAGRLPLDHPLVQQYLAAVLPAETTGTVALALSCGRGTQGLHFEGRLSAEDLGVGADRLDGEVVVSQDAGGLQLDQLRLQGSRGLSAEGQLQLPFRLELDGHRMLPGEIGGRIQARVPGSHPLVARWWQAATGLSIDGFVALTATAEAGAAHPQLRLAVVGEDLRLDGVALQLAVDAQQDAQGIVLETLHIDAGRGLALEASGRLPWTVSRRGLQPTASDLQLSGSAALDLDHVLLQALVPELGRGRLALEVDAREDPDRGPVLEAALALAGFLPELPVPPELQALIPGIGGHLTLAADPRGWHAQARLDGPAILRAELGGAEALDLADLPAWVRRLWTARFDGRFTLELPDLAWIGSLIPRVSTMSGRLRVEGGVGGTPAAPQWAASGYLAQFLLQTRTGFPLASSGNASFHLADGDLVVDALAVDLGYETVTARGRIPLDPRARPVDLRIGGENALLYRDQTVRLRADLDLALTGRLHDLLLSGAMGITDFAYVRTVAMFGTGETALPQVEPLLFSLNQPVLRSLRFDVRVQDGPLDGQRRREEPVRIRSNLVRGDLGVDMRLSGTGLEPHPVGTIVVRTGLVFMPFGVYRVRSGELRYVAGQPRNPEVDVRAVTRIQGYDVTVLVRGTLLNPKLEVATSPFLDREDAILLATTGLLPSDIDTGGMAVGVAAAYVGRRMLNTLFSGGAEGELGFFSEMQLDVATDEAEGGIASARAEIPLRPPFYVWAEYENTNWYDSVNGGLGYRFTPGREIEARPAPSRGKRAERLADAPRWIIQAPAKISESWLLEAASEPYRDFARWGYDLAAAHDGAFAMQAALRQAGYASAEVDFRREGGPGSPVTFLVEPGPLYQLTELRLIDGRDWSVIDDLQNPGRALPRLLPGIDDKYIEALEVDTGIPYSEARIEEAAGAVERIFRFAGYREAELGPILNTFDPQAGRAFVDIVIRAGPRFVIRDLTITGIDGLDPELRRRVRSFGDLVHEQAYVERRLVLAQALMRDALSDAGHLAVTVEYTVEATADGRVGVHYRVEPGPLHLLNKIVVEWADTPPERRRTLRSYIRYKFDLDRGSVLGQSEIDSGLRYLLASGFLSEVRIERRPVPVEHLHVDDRFPDLSEPDGPEVVDLVVTITEQPARTVDVELGYGSYDLVVGRVRYTDRNLFGSGRILEITPQASLKGHGLSLRLLDRDWLVKWLGPDHWLELQGGYLEHEEPTFDRERYEAGLSLRKDWSPHFGNRVEYRFTSERAENIEGGIAAVEESGFIRNGTFGLGGRLDYRNHPALPSSGWMLDLMVSWSTPPFGSELDYFELDVSTSRVLNLWREGGLVLMLGARYTSRDPLDNAPSLPVQFRLFNGGAGSVRSFAFNQLSPVDEAGDPQGGLSRGSATAELRLRLGESAWHLAAFYDIGFVDPKAYALQDEFDEDFGHAVGGGIRYDLPVGPIRLDAAWGPGPRFAADDDWAIHFAIGHSY